MSWFLFKEATAHQPRGKKVDGFEDMHRPKISLTWGIDYPTSKRYQSKVVDIEPITNETTQPKPEMRVMTDYSDQETEELTKLIKQHHEKKRKWHHALPPSKPEQDYDQIASILRRNHDDSLKYKSEKNQVDTKNSLDERKRIRFLQNSLLPQSKRQNMGAIMDYDLGSQIRLDESRVSGKSAYHNKKNQSNVMLGDGFNCFNSKAENKKDFNQELQEIYQYEEKRKHRMISNQLKLG